MKKLVIGAMAALTFVAAGTATVSVFHAAPAYAANAKAVVVQAVAAGRISETIGGYLAAVGSVNDAERNAICLLYTSPSPRDGLLSRMPSSA